MKTQVFRVVEFEQNYTQCFFEDGTYLSWSNQSVMYFSPLGNRTFLNLKSIQQSSDLQTKLLSVINVLNRYNDDYIVNNIEGHPHKSIFKKYKIHQYLWSQGLVRQTEANSFELLSDDLNAKITLLSDLYRIHIDYLQRTDGKKVSESSYLSSKNMTKSLLQKYHYEYTEYPSLKGQIDIQYQYQSVHKQFCIFTLPQRWYAPLRKIWNFILANKIVQDDFCYIDFNDPDNSHLTAFETTEMPTFRQLIHHHPNQADSDGGLLKGLPIFGHPNHRVPSRWIYLESLSSKIICWVQDRILDDGIGFWFLENSMVGYKRVNRNDFDYQTHVNAFPFTVRFPNQPERYIKNDIGVLYQYIKHNAIATENTHADQQTDHTNSAQKMHQEFIEGVGNFRAYANQMVVAKFLDKTIMTLRNKEVKVISSTGQNYILYLNSQTEAKGLYRQYTAHLREIQNFFQRTYYPEDWQSRQSLNQELDHQLKTNQMFIEACKRLTK